MGFEVDIQLDIHLTSDEGSKQMKICFDKEKGKEIQHQPNLDERDIVAITYLCMFFLTLVIIFNERVKI